MKDRDRIFKEALKGKHIAPLTLDNKWHQLFTQTGTTKKTEELSGKLNKLLKKHGEINSKAGEIKKLKKRLLDEIMENMDSSGTSKKSEDNRKLVEECNRLLEGISDELLDIPHRIDEVNFELMLETMRICYERISINQKEIDEISAWTDKIRVEIKKRLVRKQQCESDNQKLYHYMHDIFGPEVIDIFDMYSVKGNNNN